MNNHKQRPPLSWGLISVFIIVSVVISILGILFVNYQRRLLLIEKENELTTVGNLKIGQIHQWRYERIGFANVIHDDPSIAGQIYNFIYKPDNSLQKRELLNWMNSILVNFDYQSIKLIDTKNKIRISVPDSNSTEDPMLIPYIRAAIDSQKVLIIDVHSGPLYNKTHLDFIIPMVRFTVRDSSIVGVIDLSVNPDKILFRLVENWPTPSKSAETLILRKEGDSIVYLNNLKYIPNSSLTVRRSIKEERLLGAQVVSGVSGIVEGVDYRNEEVIGYVKKIHDSPWYIVSKMDKKEIVNSFRERLFLAKLLIIFFFSSLAGIIGWMIWHQRMRYYRQKYETEVERLAVRKHFEYILKYANDIILLFDNDLFLVEVNDRALEVYKYSRNEIIGMHARSLRDPDEVSLLEKQINELNEVGYSRYETIHVSKDGSSFPIEISARLVEFEGTKYYQVIGRDISERKKIEDSLKVILERYNLATEAAKLAVWDWDVVNDLLVWDDNVYKLFGVNKDDMPPVYDSWLNLLYPEDLERSKSEIEKAIKGEKEYNTEFRVVMPDGSLKNIKAFGHVVRNEDGKAVRMIGINYDITEQRKAENLLREREFWLSESQRVGKIGSYILDIKANTWTSSEVLDDIFGISADTQKTIESWNSLIHPEQRVEMLNYFLDDVIGRKKPFDREYRIVRHNSTETAWVWGRGELSYDSDGNPEKMFGTIQDITERKKSEILKENTNSLLLATLESTADGILVVDPKGKIVQFNSKFTEMWKIPEVILNSREDEKALSFVRDQLKDPDSFLNNVKHLYSQRDAVSFDVLEFADGRLFERYSQPQKIGNEIIGRVWSFRDVTLRKIAEDQLVSAKEKAEESDRLKTAFLHNISHEIRTPMNAIVGFTTLLDDSDLQPDTRKQYIEIIFQSSNQLLSIITDIVDISNIETGQIKVSFNRVNINAVIHNLYDQYKLRAEQQGLEISYFLSLNDEDAFIETDSTKLVQIMSNLLNNSLKFTKSGTINFGYNLRNDSIEFYVRDTGIGIPNDKLSKIFERFYQIENSISRQYGGTGLGLSICKAYARLLNGEMTVESEERAGSTFCLKLPFIKMNGGNQNLDNINEKAIASFTGKTILVAEDDEINYLVVKKSLEPVGFKLIRAENGKEAVDICKSNRNIDLVLLDLKMPVMDGLEAMKLIKEFRPEMIFVALSAYAFDSDRKNAMELGCSDYISKPFSKKELLEILEKYQ